MKVNREIFELIADLEYLVGSECYNPNSYDGWQDIDGCDFRYPINVPKGEEDYVKIRGNINSSSWLSEIDRDKTTIRYMKYRFGSNELFIGRGLLGIMEYLEQRYGIDFNALEAEYQEKVKNDPSENKNLHRMPGLEEISFK